MTSHSYEVALYGKFLKGDLKSVLNRIALHSESAHQIHSREVIFDPPDGAQQREANQEPALLRALKELLEPDAKW
jgi:mediator of RNA polymerase II transcription subunit 18